MLSDKIICRLLHPFYVKIVGNKIVCQSLGRNWRPRIDNMVFVCFLTIAIPWMEIRGYFLRFYNHNIIWESLI